MVIDLGQGTYAEQRHLGTGSVWNLWQTGRTENRFYKVHIATTDTFLEILDQARFWQMSDDEFDAYLNGHLDGED